MVLVLYGVYNIFLAFDNLLEMATFLLVVKLMLPITLSDKDSRSKYQKFLFKGFLDRDHL